jgi:hypothetical protein
MAEIAAKESPFTPGRPVPVEYFVARYKEIERLERAIKQTVSGRNENAFITGERGIGKSSLAGFVRYLAEKEHSLIGTHCYLGGVRNLEDMVGAIFHRLLQDCTDKSLFDKLGETFKSYIKGFTFFGVGVEFTRDKTELRTLVDDFLPVMRKIYDEAKENDKKGLILILDDLNGLSDVPEFSQFLKSFVDTLATSGKPLPMLLVLVGLPQRREDLIKHQPSVARILDVVDLPTMSNSESEDFFRAMFTKQHIGIDDAALSLVVQLSGGYPMLMHEVGDAVFWEDSDGQIDLSDARQGITEAARNVGRKYIGTQVSNVLRNKTYSSILLRVGKKLPIGATFKRQELLKQKASENERKNLDNFLNKVKRLGIMKDADARGEYTFVNPLYHLYIWYEANNRRD